MPRRIRPHHGALPTRRVRTTWMQDRLPVAVDHHLKGLDARLAESKARPVHSACVRHEVQRPEIPIGPRADEVKLQELQAVEAAERAELLANSVAHLRGWLACRHQHNIRVLRRFEEQGEKMDPAVRLVLKLRTSSLDPLEQGISSDDGDAIALAGPWSQDAPQAEALSGGYPIEQLLHRRLRHTLGVRQETANEHQNVLRTKGPPPEGSEALPTRGLILDANRGPHLFAHPLAICILQHGQERTLDPLVVRQRRISVWQQTLVRLAPVQDVVEHSVDVDLVEVLGCHREACLPVVRLVPPAARDEDDVARQLRALPSLGREVEVGVCGAIHSDRAIRRQFTEEVDRRGAPASQRDARECAVEVEGVPRAVVLI
mmetsp:Transcript_22414/g.62694  ORF Transcript_22414/g.62694 Transcript_22414/m.62694 type:complete len:374 (-) Transcript_22414:584-1705(-)